MLTTPLHARPRRLFAGLYLFAATHLLSVLLPLVYPFLLALRTLGLYAPSIYWGNVAPYLSRALPFLFPFAVILAAWDLGPSIPGGKGHRLYRTIYSLSAFISALRLLFSPLTYHHLQTNLLLRRGHSETLFNFNLADVTVGTLCDLICSALTLYALASLARSTTPARIAKIAPSLLTLAFVVNCLSFILVHLYRWQAPNRSLFSSMDHQKVLECLGFLLSLTETMSSLALGLVVLWLVTVLRKMRIPSPTMPVL